MVLCKRHQFPPLVYESKEVASQATCCVYFWVAAVSLREGSFPLAEKARSVYSFHL